MADMGVRGTCWSRHHRGTPTPTSLTPRAARTLERTRHWVARPIGGTVQVSSSPLSHHSSTVQERSTTRPFTSPTLASARATTEARRHGETPSSSSPCLRASVVKAFQPGTHVVRSSRSSNFPALVHYHDRYRRDLPRV